MPYTPPETKKSEENPSNSNAIILLGWMNRKNQPVKPKLTQFNPDDLPLKVTPDGFNLNGVRVKFADWIPNWPQLKPFHLQVDPTIYKRFLAAMVTFMQFNPAAAHHTDPAGGEQHCFNDTDSTGGVGRIHSHPQEFSAQAPAFHKQIMAALFQQEKCGPLSLTNCTDSLVKNITAIYEFVYPDPKWVKNCIDYAIESVGGFGMNDMFDLKHVKCIDEYAQNILAQLSQAAEKQLENAHKAKPSSGNAVGDVFLALFVIGLLICGAYLAHYYRKNGHMPACPSMPGRGGGGNDHSGYDSLDGSSSGERSKLPFTGSGGGRR